MAKKKRPSPAAEPEPFSYLAVVSEGNAFGGYRCAVQYGGHPLMDLDPDRAAAYATEVTWAITCAEYDAGVFKQLNDMVGMPLEATVHVLRTLRNQRRPILGAATHPLQYEPILSNRDKVPRLLVRLAPEAWRNRFPEEHAKWQWDLPEARQHVAQVMEVSAGVDLDVAYLRLLKTEVGLEPREAQAVVNGLREFLPGMILTDDPE